MMLSSNAYATFVVGFAIMTDSMIYTLVLPFLPDLFAGRLHVPESQISQWNASAFEVFAVATLLSNLVVGFFADASASKSRPFLLSVVIMVASTILFFIGTTPEMILVSRAIQGVSTTFTWVTGLAYLVAKVGEGELGAYVGWTTVGVAVGEIVGPLVGGPVYDYFGHWAAFGVVEALLLVDILLRVLAKDNKPGVHPETRVEQDTNAGVEQDLETNSLLQDGQGSSTDYNTMGGLARETNSHRSPLRRLAWDWLGTVFTLIVIFMVRGALEVAVPLYLTRQYSWTPTKISMALMTITVPAALNPIVGELTSRQGPRWWSTGTFAICGAAFISFGNVAGHSEESQTLFIVHSVVIGISLAVLVNSNQVAISVAAQRYGIARTHAEDKDEDLGRTLSWLSPSMMLSGVTSSWAAGILLGPAYSNLMAYTEDAGWEIFCRGLGGLCLVAAVGSSFLWRTCIIANSCVDLTFSLGEDGFLFNMRLFAILALATEALAVSYPEQQVLTGGTSHYSVQTPPLDTDWTYEVGTDPWPQYPRPKLARSNWQSLNGIWTYENAPGHHALRDPPFNQTLSQEVLVPFCLESGLSGIQGTNTIYSWYRTTFTVPSTWSGDQLLLNFGAVDYEATVFVNGWNATFHRGGYSSFSVDVTQHLNGGENELIVFAFDPTDGDDYVIPIGKQTLHPSHIFYRPCSGIWQSVWIESAPKNYISDLSIDGDASGVVTLALSATKSDTSKVHITVSERGTNNPVATHTATVGSPITFKVPSPKTWSPDSPNLYDVTVKMGEDTVRSYTGFRTVTREEVNGVQRILLNGNAIFVFGTLDQGYWPDGLYTAPTYEAMTFDIKTLKRLGYNMLRKHIKVEPALYYAAADELGILIMQDMPSLPSTKLPNTAQQAEFERQLQAMVTQLKSYASVFAWVIYNEGWGQRNDYNPEFGLTDIIRELDPTRLVDAVSGWFDHGAGDFSDSHDYTSPRCGIPQNHIDSEFDPSRIGFQGEFGGTGHNVSAEHLWKVQQAIDGISETYEMYETLDAWKSRGHSLLGELLSQVQSYSCAGAVWTGTTDVEGELNGMMTYDRRIVRPDVQQWHADIQAVYDASTQRSNGFL